MASCPHLTLGAGEEAVPATPRGTGPRPRMTDNQGGIAMEYWSPCPNCEPAVLVQGLEAELEREDTAF